MLYDDCDDNVVDNSMFNFLQDKDGWYNVVVYFEDRTLNLDNNGVKLFQQTDILGKLTTRTSHTIQEPYAYTL